MQSEPLNIIQDLKLDMMASPVDDVTIITRTQLESLEAALSTDAEPVAIYKGNGLFDCGDGGHHNIELLKLIPANTPLYAAPPATCVAVKAIEAVWKYGLVIESSVRRGDGPDQYAGVNEALRLVKEARSALSAQVQDVAETEREKAAFNHGYVIACCNVTNLHDEPGIAHDTLRELGVTKAEVKRMDLSEYDAKALREIEHARGPKCAIYKTAAPAAKQGEAE